VCKALGARALDGGGSTLVVRNAAGRSIGCTLRVHPRCSRRRGNPNCTAAGRSRRLVAGPYGFVRSLGFVTSTTRVISDARAFRSRLARGGMAALHAQPTAAGLRSRQDAAGGSARALRCNVVACTRQLAAAARSARYKPAAATGRRLRFLVAASDVRFGGGAWYDAGLLRSRNACTALQRQVEDWEPLETPSSPPARLPQPLPPLPPPPPLARSGMSDTSKAAGA